MPERFLVGKVHFAFAIQFANVHNAICDLVDLSIAYPLYVAIAQLRFQHGFRVAHASQAQMANIGLAGHIGNRHFVTNFRVAQGFVQNEGIFVRRAKTTGALKRTDNSRPRVSYQFFKVAVAVLSMVKRTNRLCEAVRSCAFNGVESQSWPGGNDQIVITNFFTFRRNQQIGFCINLVYSCAFKADVFLRQVLFNGHGYRTALSPAYRYPGV